MKASAHKYIVMTALGCAVVCILLVVLGVVLAVRRSPLGSDKNLFSRITEELYSPAHARAALDSLEDLDFTSLARPSPRFVLPPRGTGNGAAAAVRIWRDSAYANRTIWFGDTLPDTSSRRAEWLASAEWPAVDSLVAAARRPWLVTGGAVAGPDTAGRLRDMLLDPGPILWTTRAMLARAHSLAERAPARADTMVFAVITIARRLEEDALLGHALLGYRIERDALSMLWTMWQDAERDEWEDVLDDQGRVEEAEDLLRRASQLIRRAGPLPEQAPALASRVLDTRLPPPIRGEIALAIGYGWSYDPAEGQRLSAARREALDDLAGRDLPKGLAAVVRGGRAAVRAGFARRFVLSREYQALVADVQYGRFSRPR